MGKVIEKISVLHSLKKHDPITYEHSVRVADLCVKFGSYLKMNDKSIHELFQIGLYHDVGKLYVDSSVLLKKGKLNNEEYKQILNHTVYGEQILKKQGFANHLLRPVRSHHENYNGTGYPDNLKSHEIDIYSFILRIVDSFDAMTNLRTYKDAYSKEYALQEVQSLKGDWYHPYYADRFNEYIFSFRKK